MNARGWVGGGPAAQAEDPRIPFGKGWDLARRLTHDAYGRPRPGAAYPRASPPAAGPPVSSDWLTGIWEAQTWSNGLKSKEIWGPCFMHMGPSILAFWRPGGSIFGVWGHHFDASLLIQGHWGRPTGYLGAQILIFVDF